MSTTVWQTSSSTVTQSPTVHFGSAYIRGLPATCSTTRLARFVRSPNLTLDRNSPILGEIFFTESVLIAGTSLPLTGLKSRTQNYSTELILRVPDCRLRRDCGLASVGSRALFGATPARHFDNTKGPAAPDQCIGQHTGMDSCVPLMVGRR